MFGGLSDYKILNSIEKYDLITDTWISLYFKLPVPLAKLATCPLGGKSILIMGGMSADYEPNSNVYQLDLNLSKFLNKRPMKFERLFEGGQGVFTAANGSVYVLNGCLDSNECERYRPSKDQWDLMPSYSSVSGGASLNGYIGACIIEE